METIAASAGVSTGTVYNYFGTKNAVLAAVVTGQVDDILEEAEGRVDLTAEYPADALMPMLGVYLDRMTEYGPDLLKEWFRAGLDPAQTALLADFVSADERAVAKLSDAMVRMQARGLMPPDIDVNGAAFLVYSIVAVALMMYMSVPGATPGDVRTQTRSQLGLAFGGLGIRHDSPNG